MPLSATIRQTQALALTPQMLQSIRLLRMSSAELSDHVAAELERNPLLKSRDRPGRHPAVADRSGRIAAPLRLGDVIEEQIVIRFRDPRLRMIARTLAAMLDSAGYLPAGMDEIAAACRASQAEIDSVLDQCRRFDPPGIFARNLAECLTIQLQNRKRLDPAMQAMLGRLDLLARRDFAALKRICGVDDAELAHMFSEIRKLDPKPGSAYAVESAPPIVADVLVAPAADGGWQVTLNPAALPDVLLDHEYHANILAEACNAVARQYLEQCRRDANWLIQGLSRRAQTLLRIASEIVRQQDGFFRRGMIGLRPLVHREIAEAAGMHETTVSRAIAGKFIATPHGILEIRSLFSPAIAATSGGMAHSAQAVRQRIRALVAQEAGGHVLSDGAIMDALRRNGIEIARRTVAKYREEMHIPSSARRRREMRAQPDA